MKHSNFFRC